MVISTSWEAGMVSSRLPSSSSSSVCPSCQTSPYIQRLPAMTGFVVESDEPFQKKLIAQNKTHLAKGGIDRIFVYTAYERQRQTARQYGNDQGCLVDRCQICSSWFFNPALKPAPTVFKTISGNSSGIEIFLILKLFQKQKTK